MKQLAFDIGQELLLNPGDSTSGIGNQDEYKSIGAFISSILPNVYVFIGVILFVILIAGGILMITSAGSGDEEKTAQGKKVITTAAIGLAIVLASWWAIQIIKVLTGISILE